MSYARGKINWNLGVSEVRKQWASEMTTAMYSHLHAAETKYWDGRRYTCSICRSVAKSIVEAVESLYQDEIDALKHPARDLEEEAEWVLAGLRKL